MLELIAFLALLCILGRSLLGRCTAETTGAVPIVLPVLVGLPIVIALGSLLLALGVLNFRFFLMLAGLFVTGGFLLPKILRIRYAGIESRASVSDMPCSMLKNLKSGGWLGWAMFFLDIVVAAGICIATFHICGKWQGNVSPDVWAHINWARSIATTQAHDYAYMPGAHILIWLVTKIFGCNEYEAAMQLPVFFRIYFGLVAYFAGSRVLNRTTGLMLTLVFLASPVMATSHAALFLPRNLAHPLFLLGLLLAVYALVHKHTQYRLLIAAGIAIGTTVITHLAWDEILQCGSLAVVLVLVAALRRRLFKRVLVIVLPALAVTGPFIARMVFHKLQAGSFLNITVDRLVAFSWKELYLRAHPYILWAGAICLVTVLLAWIAQTVLKDRSFPLLPVRVRKTGILCAVWAVLTSVSLFFLLCVGKGRLEVFVYGILPLPHPVNTEHFFTMLVFGLLGGAAMIGYLPACVKGKWQVPTIGIAAILFALFLIVSVNVQKSSNASGFVSTNSIVMWSALAVGVIVADNSSLLQFLLGLGKRWLAAVAVFPAVLAVVTLPDVSAVQEFNSQRSLFVAKLSQVQHWIISHTEPDAVLISHWPYLDSLEYLLNRHIKDGLLGPGALMSFHRGATPRKYWHTLRFENNKITNAPKKIVEVLHADFGSNVYLYFRVESLRAFPAYRGISNKLTPYTSTASQEFFTQPTVEEPKKRFMNMIEYFQSHSQYFKRVAQDNQSVLFKLIK